MQIERMTEGDLGSLSAMEQEIFGSHAWSRELFWKHQESPRAFSGVLKEKGRLIGYILCEIVSPEATILKLAVHPLHRRKGCASLLLDHLLAEMKKQGVDRIFLEVRQSNHAARAFYSQAGFKILSRREQYYPDGEDAVVMLLDL